MSEMTLLPCPFCGKSEVDYQASQCAFYCHTCGAIGPDDPDANPESWNRRAAPDVRAAALEEAAKICEGRAGDQSMGAFRVLMSAAAAIRAASGNKSEPEQRSPEKPE